MIHVGEIAQVVDCEHRTAPRTLESHFGFSVGTSAVRGGRIVLEAAKPVSKETFESWTKRAVPQPGDLIFSREAPMGEVGAVPEGAPICLGQRTVLLRPDARQVDKRFLLHALMAPGSQQWIRDNAVGSGVLHLNVADVRRIPLPSLPPLDEQSRIVDLLEDHLSRLDAADAGLDSSRLRLDSLKRSLLAELHIGRPLPLSELAWDSGYGTSERCIVGGPGVPVVRIPNLVDGVIDLTDEKRVADPNVDLSGSMLAAGDLLIVRTNGSVDLIGRSAVVQDGIAAAFASYLIRYRLRGDLVRPAWIQAMLSAPQLRRRIEPLAASSAGQHNLSLAKLDPLELPVPSLEQQDASLARLREMDTRIASVRSDIGRGRRQSAALRRSLLAAAFAGRLTEASAGLQEIEEMIGA